LALIGEQFDHGDEICGAVVSVRARQEKIAIWTKNASNEAAQVVLSKRKEDYIYILDCLLWIVNCNDLHSSWT
jgi:translation initiation factor 4E